MITPKCERPRTLDLQIGRITVLPNGHLDAEFHTVRITGQILATLEDRTDNERPTRQSLIITEETGRLLVHEDRQTTWVNEPSLCLLYEISTEDLAPLQEYSALGDKAGLGRNLTIDEALQLSHDLAPRAPR